MGESAVDPSVIERLTPAHAGILEGPQESQNRADRAREMDAASRKPASSGMTP